MTFRGIRPDDKKNTRVVRHRGHTFMCDFQFRLVGVSYHFRCHVCGEEAHAHPKDDKYVNWEKWPEMATCGENVARKVMEG